MFLSLKDARGSLDRAELHKILDQLLDLRERTDPIRCPEPATIPLIDPSPDTVIIGGETVKVLEMRRGKDEAAGWAVFMAINLAASIAGWALNHRVGRNLDIGADPDSHDREIAGMKASSADGAEALSDPLLCRKILASLTASLQTTMPPTLGRGLTVALEALDHGETMPLLEPLRRGKHGKAYSLLQAKRDLIELVHFRAGAGVPPARTYKDIAEAVNKDESTIKNWDWRDIPRDLGEADAEKLKADARLAGEYTRKDDSTPGWRIGVTVDGIASLLGRHLNDMTIAELAQRYLRAERDE